MAISPPFVGPNVTVQRPSTSASGPEPQEQVPGSTVNPFAPTTNERSIHREEQFEQRTQSPIVQQTNTTTPLRPSSRAARNYTPVELPREARERSSSTQRYKNDIPVVTDSPSPLPRQRNMVEDPRVTAFRNAAYASPPRDLNAQRTDKQPEMQQMNRSNIPFMPSPDVRPPSDTSLPLAVHHRDTMDDNLDAPSMPALSVPDLPGTAPATSANLGRRERSRSKSASRKNSTDSIDTLRAFSPSHKKSVSFAAKPDYNEAPKQAQQDERYSSPGRSDETVSRSERSERSRERDRDRQHRHSNRDHQYDAGDDFSDDTPFEDDRRRSQDRRERDRGNRHDSRRERSNTQSLDREKERDKHRDPRRSKTISSTDNDRSRSGRKRDDSPGSDSTIELPDRFDRQGRQVSGRSKDEDVLAEKLDQILGGLFGGSSKKR